MIVVSDTTPLRYLTVLGQIELLPWLFPEVRCPDAVIRECLHPAAPAELRMWASSPPGWLRVDTVLHPDGDLALLDDGEAATITLGRRLSADLLLNDERNGRQVAKSLGFQVAGTLSILAQAGRRGWLDYPTVTARLRETTNFRASPEVVQAAWDEATTGEGDS